MTSAELKRRITALEKYKAEVIKPFYEEYEKVLNAAAETVGLNEYFQDEDGIVYKIVVPEGRFVRFEKFAVNRTRYPDEDKGTLSETEAKKAGFELPARAPKPKQ